jgi:uncharacterized protein
LIGEFFYRAFQLFSQRKISFLLGIILISGFSILGISSLSINTSIYSIFPDQPEFAKFSEIIKKDLNNHLIVSIETDGLEEYQVKNKLDTVAHILKSDFSDDILSIHHDFSSIEDQLLEHFYTYPFYGLTQDDYDNLAQSLHEDSVRQQLEIVYEQLSSANSIFMRRTLIKDPLGIVWKGLSKHQPTNDSSSIKVEEGVLVNKQQNLALIKCRLQSKTRTVDENIELEYRLNKVKERFKKDEIKMDYFSPFLIANANSKQVKKDTRLTIIISISLLLFLLLFYYRTIIVSIHFVTSIGLSILFGLGITSLFVTEISGMAVAASAVVLGIVMDYSFHFLTHYSDTKDISGTIKELAQPLLIGSFTTIAAFAAMLFVSSRALQHFGLLALCTLGSAAIVTLTVLPILLKVTKTNFKIKESKSRFTLPSWVKRIAFLTSILFVIIVFIRPPKVSFDGDPRSLSIHPDSLKKKELQYTALDFNREKRILLISESESLKEVLQTSNDLYDQLTGHKGKGIYQISSVAPYALSADLANERLENWNMFWEEHFDSTYAKVQSNADSLGFLPNAFTPFESFVKDYETFAEDDLSLLDSLGIEELLQKSEEGYRAIASITIDLEKRATIKKQLENSSIDFYWFETTEEAKAMLRVVQDDFNYLLIFSSLFVFISLLVVDGRIEMAMFSFFPIATSWLWILYLGELVGISFNFVNIIITTIIFGLGDDFSIFVTDGLLKKYTFKKNDLSSYNKAILLSALTTIIGTGVLSFAKHPSIHSIALLSVVGILSILLVTVFLQPYIFKLFVTGRADKKFTPITFLGLVYTCFLYFYFATGCILLNILLLGFILYPIKKTKKRRIINYIISKLAASALFMAFHLKKRIVNREKLNFESPAFFIANHVSFLDILITLKMSPKMIIVVKSWVYNSPFFGLLIRYSGYISITNGNEENLVTMKQRLEEGYSIMIFPEGTRSATGEILRFHKGVFFAAKELKTDIQPVVITGAELINPKGDFIIKKGTLSAHILDRVPATDPIFEQRLGLITKEFSNKMRSKLVEFRLQDYDQRIMKFRLSYNYLYKGLIREMYFHMKWNFEKNDFYAYDSIIDKRKRILDLGCGYGHLSYFLHYRNPEREIIGFDKNQKKVELAEHSAYKGNNLHFIQEDISNAKVDESEVAIFKDSLRFIQPEQRKEIIHNLMSQLDADGLVLIQDDVKGMETSSKKKPNWISSKLFKLVETESEYDPISIKELKQIATECGARVDTYDQTTISNTLIILKKTHPYE